MAIKIAQLQFFVAAATSQNLAEAASRVHRTPAALSISLKQLEAELGGTLFEGERKNQLSPLGRFVLQQAQRELAHFEKTIETISRYAKAETGLVRIASVPSIAISLLPPLLKTFHEQHPNFHLDIRDMDSQSVVDAVSAGEVDIGIASVPSNIPDLTQDFLFADVFGVVCSADNPLCDLNRAVRWADLEGQTFINSGIVRAIHAPEFRPIRENAKISVRNTSSLLALVAQGLGVTLLPELLLRSDSSKQLRFLPLEDNRIIRSVSVITAPSASLDHATYSFLKALKACKPAWAEDQPQVSP